MKKVKIGKDELPTYYYLSTRSDVHVDVDNKVLARWKRTQKHWDKMQDEMQALYESHKAD